MTMLFFHGTFIASNFIHMKKTISTVALKKLEAEIVNEVKNILNLLAVAAALAGTAKNRKTK